MTSPKKSALASALAAKADQSKMDLALAKIPWKLPLKQKPNGNWSYRFGKPFRKLKQSSLSDYNRDPEDLILERNL